MKKAKKFVKKLAACMAAAALLMLLPQGNAVTVHADEPSSYAVKFVPDKGWVFQYYTNTFDDSAECAEIRYLRDYAKEGDVVVVYNDVGTFVPLDLSGTHLSNITLVQNTQQTILNAGTVDDLYVLGGSYCAINGNVKNANVYDLSVCTFNDNVGTLTIYALDSTHKWVTSTVSCAGTVDHYIATTMEENAPIYHDCYSFAEGTFNVKDGTLTTAAINYSLVPPAEPTVAPDAAVTPTAPEAEAAPSAPEASQGSIAAPPASDDEYDDVPKTGESFLCQLLLLASITCFAGSRALRRSVK